MHDEATLEEERIAGMRPMTTASESRPASTRLAMASVNQLRASACHRPGFGFSVAGEVSRPGRA
jgi:hypothetical protein